MTIRLRPDPVGGTSTESKEARTTPAKYLFLDIVKFTQGRTVEAQTEVISSLNTMVRDCLKRWNVSEDKRILLPTGDGMCIALLNVEIPYDVHILLAVSILAELARYNFQRSDSMRQFEMRIGINANTDNIVIDINGQKNIAGAGINIAQRVMSMADGNQILISDTVYNTLRFREKYVSAFKEFMATVKHGEQVRMYQLIQSGLDGVNTNPPSALVVNERDDRVLPRLLGFYFAFAAVHKNFFKSLTLSNNDEDSGVTWLYYMAKDAVNQEILSDGDKTASLLFRGGAVDTRTQYLHYLKFDNRVKSQLVDLFQEAYLGDFADMFIKNAVGKTDYRYLLPKGYSRLETDWPDIYAKFKVKNYTLD